MFSPTSRYANASTQTVTTARGQTVTATKLPVRARPSVRGYHARVDGQRPDGIAAYYLTDATATWQLCDATGTIAPDALATRSRVAVPRKVPK